MAPLQSNDPGWGLASCYTPSGCAMRPSSESVHLCFNWTKLWGRVGVHRQGETRGVWRGELHVCSYGDPYPCLGKDLPLWFVRGEGPTPLETILHLCSTKNPNKHIGSLERLLILPPSFSRWKNALICGWDLRRSAVTVFAFPRGRDFISNFLQRVGFLVDLFKDKSYQVF